MPAGREDVGDHDVVVLLLLRVRRQTQTVEVGIGHAQVLGLAAVVGAHIGEAVGGAGHAGVGCAGKRRSGRASQLRQKPQPMLNGRHTQSPTLTRSTRAADLDDLAEVLVTEHAARLHIRAALVHMKIGTADIGVRDLDESVRRLLDLRVRHVLYADIPRSVVDKCFHGFTPCDLRPCDPLCRESKEEDLKRMAHAATERLDRRDDRPSLR